MHCINRQKLIHAVIEQSEKIAEESIHSLPKRKEESRVHQHSGAIYVQTHSEYRMHFNCLVMCNELTQLMLLNKNAENLKNAYVRKEK